MRIGKMSRQARNVAGSVDTSPNIIRLSTTGGKSPRTCPCLPIEVGFVGVWGCRCKTVVPLRPLVTPSRWTKVSKTSPPPCPEPFVQMPITRMDTRSADAPWTVLHNLSSYFEESGFKDNDLLTCNPFTGSVTLHKGTSGIVVVGDHGIGTPALDTSPRQLGSTTYENLHTLQIECYIFFLFPKPYIYCTIFRYFQLKSFKI